MSLTWTPRTTPVGNSGTNQLIWVPDNGGFFAGPFQSSSGSSKIDALLSSDGITWTNPNPGLGTAGFSVGGRAICYLPSRQRLVVGGNTATSADPSVIYSDDFGVTWTSGAIISSTFRRIETLAYSDLHDVLLATTIDNTAHKTLAKSTDGGATWTVLSPPWDTSFIGPPTVVHSEAEDVFVIATAFNDLTNVFIYTTQTGSSFTAQTSPWDGGGNACPTGNGLYFDDLGAFYIGGQDDLGNRSMLKGVSAGTSWSVVDNFADVPGGYSNIGGFAAGTEYYIAAVWTYDFTSDGQGPPTFISSTDGDTWVQEENFFDDGESVGSALGGSGFTGAFSPTLRMFAISGINHSGTVSGMLTSPFSGADKIFLRIKRRTYVE